MKLKITTTIAFILAAFVSNAQIGTASPDPQKVNVADDPETVYDFVTEKAEPDYNLMEFLSRNLMYPEEAREAEIEGRLLVNFVVEKDGSISDIKVMRGAELKHGLPEEAIRVIKKLPNWKPAKKDGKPVRSRYALPIVFKLS